mgnify:CR=1 FL=1
MQGIIVVNKQSGWTSFDVVNKLKHIYNTKKVGHLGTLDPMAEGVLPVAVGRATKLFDYYLNKTKTYIANIKFGVLTDSLDATGAVIKTEDINITEAEFKKALNSFVGKISQVPPRVSAKKINGRRAYDLARNNIEFEIKPKNVTIYEIEYISKVADNEYQFKVVCEAGTYIRSLCRDIGEKLNTIATMTKLVRTKAGEFSIENSHTISEIESNKDAFLLPLEKVLNNEQKLVLSVDNLPALINGRKLVVNEQDSKLVTVYCGDILFGLGSTLNKNLKILVRLYEGEN